MRSAVWALLLGSSLALAGVGEAGESDLDPHVLMLARAKAKVAEDLSRLPNYTCVETVERFRKPTSARKWKPVDRLRLEVALVDKKEMYAWPGSKRFEDRELTDLVPNGASGTGSFAGFLRNVFLTSAAQIRYVGEQQFDGHTAAHYRYRVPVLLSGYTLRVDPKEGIAGFHGDFWFDTKSFDILRLEIEAEDIPIYLPISATRNTIDYQRVRIGERDFLIPRAADMRITDTFGNDSFNHTVFSNCRQYTGDAVLSFDDPAPEKLSAAAAPPLELSGEAMAEVSLAAPLRGESAAIGDEVVAILNRPAKHHKDVLIPKGARLIGRISRLEKHTGGTDYYAVSLDFSTLDANGSQLDVTAEVQEIGPLLAILSNPPQRRSAPTEALPGRLQDNTFYVKGDRLWLPQGLRLLVRISPKEKS